MSLSLNAENASLKDSSQTIENVIYTTNVGTDFGPVSADSKLNKDQAVVWLVKVHKLSSGHDN